MNTKKQLHSEYEATNKIFGVSSYLWDSIHMNFSSLAFCEENRKNLIAEYLLWEDFVERAKKCGFVYYYGIDVFLEEYKNAVYNCLKNI